jgi:preprotein translocase subunit SecE
MAKTITAATDQQSTGLQPTSSDRSKKADSSKGAALEGFRSQPERIRNFLHDVRSEMRKVVAPSREEVKSTTTIVVATVFLFAGYFFIVDFVVGQSITKLIQHFTAH